MSKLLFGKIDIDAYFASKEASQMCPFCGKTEWDIEALDAQGSPPKQETFVYKLLGKTFSLKEWRSRAVLVLTCSACGFIRMQDAQMLLDWARAQKGNSQ